MNCFKDIITASFIDLIIVKSTPFKRKSIFTPIRMKCSESEQGLPHRLLLVISPCLKHDTTSVLLSSQKLILPSHSPLSHSIVHVWSG